MQPVAASRRAMRIVSGTPSATVVDVPKLDRMSLRTTPAWVRTSGPFEPSPGNGPAVSSGTGVVLEPDPLVVLEPEARVVVVPTARDAALFDVAQPARATTPTPPNNLRSSRRSMLQRYGRSGSPKRGSAQLLHRFL